METLEKWNAPMATCSCAKALGELTCDAGLFAFEKCIELAKAHSKTQTDMVVRFHHSMLESVLEVSCLPTTIQCETQYGATKVPSRDQEFAFACSAEN